MPTLVPTLSFLNLPDNAEKLMDSAYSGPGWDSPHLNNSPQIPKCNPAVYRDYRYMQFELATPYRRALATFTMVIFSPLFLVLLAISYTIRLLEHLYEYSVFRDIYHFFHSTLSFTAPLVPHGPPLVQNVPSLELMQFDCIKAPYYIFRLFTCSLLFFIQGGLTCQKVRCLDDEEFGDHIANTLFSQYLVKEEKEDAIYFRLNLSEVSDIKTFNGMFACGTDTQFRMTDSGKLEPISITMVNTRSTFTPSSHPLKWKLAKLFVMQGLAYITISYRHPRLHFPYDTVCLVTKRILPPNHPLFKLLNPHFRFSLPLNLNVLTNPFTSAIYPKWYKTYAASACDTSELLKLMDKGFKDWTFQMGRPQLNPEFPYDYSLLQYYDCIRNFIQRLQPYIPLDDFVISWANNIHSHLRGFPSGFDISKNDGLFVNVLATIIFTISIHHHADHYSFSHFDQKVVPFRLRVPPPSENSCITQLNENELMTRFDFFKQISFQQIGTFPGMPLFPLLSMDTKLIHVDYGFAHPAMTQIQEEFKTDLAKTAATLERHFSNLLPLDEMVCSTEF
ncbi:lipoxygenase [Paraphysoderma sedebokerense]|nr:lipoxygenase [Paraphysoderma sedebokerense]